MRITLVAFGTRGEVQPYIALGLGLQAAGHTVKIVTIGQFYDLVTSYGLACHPIPFHSFSDSQVSQKDTIPLKVMYQTAQQFIQQSLSVMWEACRDAEVLIFHQMSRVVMTQIVEKLGVPAFVALIHPQHLQFVFYPFRQIRAAGKPVLDFSGWLRQQLEWHLLFKGYINRWRRDVLGLPATSLRRSERKIREWQLPLLCAFSPLVFPKRPEWPDWLHITGYWFLEHPNAWRPAAELVDFLTAGPPPVCVGFGSSHQGKGIVHKTVAALTLTKQRGIIIATGADRQELTTLPPEVFLTDSVPYDWLFPQVAVTVNHGGAGSTSAGLRAGIPNVTVPFVWDQPIWGQRLAELGVAPAPIPLSQCTVERLAQAIDFALHNQGLRSRAVDLGEKIRAEHGVMRAVEVFQQHLNQREESHGTQSIA